MPLLFLNRLQLKLLARLALASTLLACTLVMAQAAKPSQAAPQREELTIEIEEAIKPWAGDLDGMIERRMIRVLTVYSKIFYNVNRGVQRGLSFDYVREFEKHLNAKLAKEKKLKKHLKVHVVFIPVPRKELLSALTAGKGDIAVSNITITPERDKLVDFSVPVYRDVSELVISGPASPAVSTVDDLAGKSVYVRKSSSYYESLLILNKRLAAENKPTVVLKEVPETLEDEDLIEMVSAGLLPLIVVDKHKADLWKQVFPKIKVHEAIALRTGAEIGWAFREKSPQLAAAIGDFVANYGETSKVRNAILVRYMKNARFVKNAASDAERRKFEALIQFFRKYGDRYDVDWLLMAAQGYQESQLNQEARSHVGAIGVMQVMPATGKDLNVGDITQIEANIHAGIKYMRWMIDNYYGNEPMTKLDKALFAFASYNAGAGRVSGLRREAAKRGLDPNVWFHNVEYVAAEKIGAETVTYVSNIYKYYIAYQLILETREAREKARQELKTSKP